MKAFILAAGEGRRMRPLTLNTPKPLLKVGALTLIEHQVIKLKKAGITKVVINLAYLGRQIEDHLGDGRRLGVHIAYSREPEMLETGGGIEYARSLIGDQPFLLVNGDVWTSFQFSRAEISSRKTKKPIHMVMVPNPKHNLKGDFRLAHGEIHLLNKDIDHDFSLQQLKNDSELSTGSCVSCTYSGISVIDPVYFGNFPDIRYRFALKEVLDWAIARGDVSGELFLGEWIDVGTPERLRDLQAAYTG